MKRSKFFYELPKELIASKPAKHRTDSRLLMLDSNNEYIYHKNFVDILNTRLDFENFMKKIDEYKFVLAPRGNGVDTHRFCEILLMGSIPIVESSGLDDLYNKFPCIIVKSFADIDINLLNSYKYDLEKEKNIQRYLIIENITDLIKNMK